MADEQDRSEALDDDKPPVSEEPPRLEDRAGAWLLDQTADADATAHDTGTDEVDRDETGSDLDGVLAEDDPGPFDESDPLSAEEAAVHLTDEP